MKVWNEPKTSVSCTRPGLVFSEWGEEKKKKRKKIFSRFSRVSRQWSLRPPWLKCSFILFYFFLNIQKCLKFYFSSSWLNSLTFMRFKINWIVFPTSDKFLKILIEKFYPFRSNRFALKFIWRIKIYNTDWNNILLNFCHRRMKTVSSGKFQKLQHKIKKYRVIVIFQNKKKNPSFFFFLLKRNNFKIHR